MSVPYVDPTTWIPFAVFAASLIGSGHCVAMCGGLVVATTKTRTDWITYQMGRLLGYLLLGSAAGGLGGLLLNPDALDWRFVSWAFSGVLAFSFLMTGLRIWQGRALHFSIISNRVLSWLFKKSGKNAALTGLFTAFLPCGWLHTFVLAAVAMRSWIGGMIFLCLFWLGTLPALSLAPWLITRLMRPFSLRFPKVAAIMLICAGLMSLGVKVWPTVRTVQESGQISCH